MIDCESLRRFIPSYEGQTVCTFLHTSINPIHPLIRRADHHLSPFFLAFLRFIPSYEGQTRYPLARQVVPAIHPFLRRADIPCKLNTNEFADSSLLTKGRRFRCSSGVPLVQFIPSCEGQTFQFAFFDFPGVIHPLLRGADFR